MLDGSSPMAVPSILIFADKTFEVGDLAQSLTDMGYDVVGVVASQADAERIIRKSAPELVLMDHHLMEEQAGQDFMDWLHVTFDIPIVYWSSSLKKIEHEKFGGKEQYVHSQVPLNKTELKYAIETALCQHNANERVQQVEEKLAGMEELAGLGSWEWDLGSGVLTLSDQASRILGFPPREVEPTFDWVLQAVHPDDREEVQQAFTETETYATPYNLEFRIIDKNGLTRFLQSRTEVFKDKRGQPNRIVGIVLDVTERRIALQAAHDSNKIFVSIFEASPDPMTITRLHDGAFLAVNKAFSQIMGYGQDEIKGLPSNQIGNYVNQSDRNTLIAKLKQGGSLDQEVIEFRRKDGSKYWGSMSAVGIEYKGEPCVLAVTRDITAYKQAEEALKKSEENYRTIFNSANDCIFVHDAKTGAILDVNAKACELFGYSHEQFLTLNVEAFSTGESSYTQESAMNLIRLAAKGEPQLFEWHSKDKQGRLFWVEVNLKEAHIWGRKCVLSIVRDITERKIADQEHASHVRFLENLNRIDRLIRTADSHEEMTRDVLETVRSIFGCDRTWLLYPCDPEAPSFRVPMESTHPDYPGAFKLNMDIPMDPKVADQYKQALNTDAPLTFRVGSENPVDDHTVRNFNVLSLMLMAVHPKVGKPWMFGMHQCSYPRIWTEDENWLFQEIGNRITHGLSSLLFLRDLRESEKKYRTLFQESADAILAVEPNGVILEANPACCALLGADKDQIIGVNVRKFYWDPSDRDAFLTEIQNNGHVRNFTWKAKRSDGSQRMCMATSSVWRDEKGEIKGYISIIHDITDTKLLEEQLFQSQKMEAVGTLAGGIAHDINNLLQVVLGHADLLLLRQENDERSRKAIESIRSAARNGAELVKRILTFSRKTEAEKRSVNLSDEVRRVRDFLRRTIPRMISIEMSLEEQVHMIHADPSQLEQVLLNLALNAKDAMPDGGRLVFETGNTTLSDSFCEAHPDVHPGNYVLLSVSDTGQGMEKQIADRIFEPFFTTKQPGEGTGLGLSTVFGIAKSHGGCIVCNSEPDVGTTFYIYFPAEESSVSADMATTIEMPAGGTETILLVDDEEAVRSLGAQMLESAGYTVLTATGGREALYVYRKNQETVDLVILDLVMPEMDGLQCFEELMKIDPTTKVLIASGYSSEAQSIEASDIQAAGFISKPFGLKQLLVAIRKSLK